MSLINGPVWGSSAMLRTPQKPGKHKCSKPKGCGKDFDQYELELDNTGKKVRCFCPYCHRLLKLVTIPKDKLPVY